MTIRISAITFNYLEIDGKQIWDLWKELKSLNNVAEYLAKKALEQGKDLHCQSSLGKMAKKYIVDLAYENREEAEKEIREAAGLRLSTDAINKVLVSYAKAAFWNQPKPFLDCMDKLGLLEYSRMWVNADGSLKVHRQYSTKNEMHKDFHKRTYDTRE